MNRSDRLTSSEDISRVRQVGKTYVDHQIVLCVLPNQIGKNRAAVIAGRSIGKAVQRNLAKRRIRSAYQSLSSKMRTGYDLVLIARKPLIERSYQSNLAALNSLLEQAKVILKEKVID